MKAAGDYAQHSANCSFQGELQQKRKIGTWTTRHCLLWEKQLLCYNTKDDAKPQVFFSLDGFQIAACSPVDDQHIFAFQLSKPAVIDHTFAVSSQHELDQWIQKLIEVGVTPTSEKLNHDQVHDQKTISALNSDSTVSSDETENTNTSTNCAQEPTGEQEPQPLEIATEPPNDKETTPVDEEIDGKEETDRVNINDFPSLDFEPTTVATPFFHTSQSFDASQIAKLGTSPQLQRSNEIEDLLKLNEHGCLLDENDGLKFKKLAEDDETDGETNLQANIGTSIDEESNILCGEIQCIQEDDDAFTIENSVSETVLEPVDDDDDDAVINNCESSPVADPTAETLTNENQTEDVPQANECILDDQDILKLDVNVTNDNVAELDESLVENKLDAENVNSEFSDSKQHDIDDAHANVTDNENSDNQSSTELNVDTDITLNHTKESDDKPNSLDLHDTKIENHKTCQQQYAGPIKRPENFSDDSDVSIEQDALEQNPQLNDTQVQNSPVSDTHETAAQSNNMPLNTNGYETNGYALDEDAQCVKNVSVKELKGVFSNSDGEPPLIPRSQTLPRSEGVKTSSKTKTLTKLPHSSIASYVNIAFECTPLATWKRTWGIICKDIIQFFASESSKQPICSIHATGVDVKPAAWETGRLLAFKLMQKEKLRIIIEPEDVESLGRWVSGLFQVIQQPVVGTEHTTSDLLNNDQHSTTLTLGPNESNQTTDLVENEVEVASVKEIRALFEDMKVEAKNFDWSKNSVNSLTSSSISSQNCSVFSSSASLPQQCENHCSDNSTCLNDNSSILSSTTVSVEDKNSSISEYKNTIEKMEAKYADVVCWLGRYIEQDEEKKVLSSTSNPFLAKLRFRHKLEMIARLEMSREEAKKKIQSLEEQLAAKEASKSNVSERYRGRLIRNAEDARRKDDDRKRIDKECTNIQTKINKAKKELVEIIETVEVMQQEIQLECENYEWGNDKPNNYTKQQDYNGSQDYDEMNDEENEDLPDWTKMAKAKAQAWKKIGNLQ